MLAGGARKVRVVIATTNGPVDVLRLASEDARIGHSFVRVNFSEDAGHLNGAYREFAPLHFGQERFRLDVSGRIDGGNSWQLGVYLAHVLQAAGRLAMKTKFNDTLEYDATVWATGAVRDDLSVGKDQIVDRGATKAVERVGSVALKLDMSATRFESDEKQTLLVVPRENAEERDVATRLDGLRGLSGVTIKEIGDLNEALRALGLEPLPTLASQDDAPRWEGNPYRGLEVFEAEHRPIFLGRAKARQDALRILQENAYQRHHSFLLILGRSGSGKSSLARAGLVPDLMNARAGTWSSAVVRPGQGSSPLTALSEALRRAGIDMPAEELTKGFGEDSAQTAKAIKASLDAQPSAADKPRHVALVVDQLEELFFGSDQAAADYGRALEALSATGRVWLIATLRSDLYHLLEQSPALFKLVQDTQAYPIAALERREIRELIREPARRAALRFEIENPANENDFSLPDRIEDDVLKAREISLPLLGFALSSLYEGRRGTLLTHEAYDRMGRLNGAIAYHAEQSLKATLDEDDNRFELEEALNRLLLSLVRVDLQDNRASTTPTYLARLIARSRSYEPKPIDAKAHDAMRKARLIVIESEGSTTITRFAHEALIQHWDRLRALIAHHRDRLALRDRLTPQAYAWANTSDPGLLTGPGKTLSAAQALLTASTLALEPEVFDFVRAAVDADVRRETEQRDRIAAQIKAEKLALRRGRWAALLVGIVLVVATTVSMALIERARATASLEIARQRAQSQLAYDELNGLLVLAEERFRNGIRDIESKLADKVSLSSDKFICLVMAWHSLEREVDVIGARIQEWKGVDSKDVEVLEARLKDRLEAAEKGIASLAGLISQATSSSEASCSMFLQNKPPLRGVSPK